MLKAAGSKTHRADAFRDCAQIEPGDRTWPRKNAASTQVPRKVLASPWQARGAGVEHPAHSCPYSCDIAARRTQELGSPPLPSRDISHARKARAPRTLRGRPDLRALEDGGGGSGVSFGAARASRGVPPQRVSRFQRVACRRPSRMRQPFERLRQLPWPRALPRAAEHSPGFWLHPWPHPRFAPREDPRRPPVGIDAHREYKWAPSSSIGARLLQRAFRKGGILEPRGNPLGRGSKARGPSVTNADGALISL